MSRVDTRQTPEEPVEEHRQGETLLDAEAGTSYSSLETDQQGQVSPAGTPAAKNKPGLFWGLEPTPELCAVALGYFVQGVKTRMAIMAEKYLMKDILLLSPAKTDVLLEIAHAPWVVKPIFGFITDSFPIFGERRRPYLVICGLGATAAYVCLGGLPIGPWVAVVFMTTAESCIAFSDVAIDGIVVERSRNEPQATAGKLQSLCWGSQAIGSLISAWSGGWLIETTGPRFTILIMAVFPLLISCTALLIPHGASSKDHADAIDASEGEEGQKLIEENPGFKGPSAKSQLSTLLSTLVSKPILLPTLFSFVWSATPTIVTTMFFFYTNALLFTPEFIGRIELLDGIAQLAGVVIFNVYLKAVPLRKVFTWICIINTLAGMTQMLLVTGLNRRLGLDDKLFVLVDSVLVEALVRIAMMPVLLLAARICPENVEATLYATLMSVQNGANGVGGLQGALFTMIFGVTSTTFTGMPWLVLTCTVLRLLPLAFLWLLPSNLPL